MLYLGWIDGNGLDIDEFEKRELELENTDVTKGVLIYHTSK